MAARHEEIADELRRAIDREEYAVGSAAARRDRPRRPLRRLARHGPPGGRGADRRGPDRLPPGCPRVVLASRRSQSFAELRSFAQWARAMGRGATGRVVAQEYRPATDGGRGTAPTARRDTRCCTSCGCAAWTASRCCWSGRSTPTGSPRPSSRIEPDCPSVTQRLYDDTGLVFAYGEHVIDAVAAGAQDAELLGVRRTSPLLRVRRVTTTREGRPVEWSDDRYRSDAVSFSVHNSIGNNALARKTAE